MDYITIGDKMEDNLRKELNELKEKVQRLENLKCGICGYNVMGGKITAEDGEKISLSPICWRCADAYKLKDEDDEEIPI